MPAYIPVIGLEIHVELKTKSKMFCSCANNPFITTPNVNICEVCLAHPGTLPVANVAGLAGAIAIAQALGCRINQESKFDRKHYFYPDLPKGYQISQYDQPIGEHGGIELRITSEQNHRDVAQVGITRVHLEEDTAKLAHDTKGNTLVDFNRAGVPLVEIVSEPDVESGVEAKMYCQELQLIFRYLGVSDADMEKGQMRCEANISLQESGRFVKAEGTLRANEGYNLNPKVEVKNINSFRAVEKAIAYEIQRQTKLLEAEETWQQETRGWDDVKQVTQHQRFKETAADYRYFPEPDIPPFQPLLIKGVVAVKELPMARRERFHTEFGFSYADAFLLTTDRHWANYTDEVMSELTEWLHSLPETHDCTISKTELAATTGSKKRPAVCKTNQELARLAGGWLTSKLMGAMKERTIDIRILKLKAENFAELIALIYSNRLNSTNAQKVLAEMLDANVNLDPTHIMEEKGYGQVSDEGKITTIVDEVIKNYPVQVEQFKTGKEPLIKFLIGMAMKASEGSADPQVVEKILRGRLTKIVIPPPEV